MTDYRRLSELADTHGQSPWLDNLRRGWITSGTLAAWVERGIRGLTSNPTIFQRAIESSTDYDEQFHDEMASGTSVADAYWELVTADIKGALAALAPVYDASDGADGFVSVEVDPALAYDAPATTAAALALHDRISAPNLMVKIPGTEAGTDAITAVLAAGQSVNVTLIFSVDRYRAVADAYLAGLEAQLAHQRAAGETVDLSRTASVASFFVSRIDTEVDRRLAAAAPAATQQTSATAEPSATALLGRAAIANARAAYDVFTQIYASERWQPLAAAGARPQRLLWASTSTKNPDYRSTLYVDELIGPQTVNTMPDATLEAFVDSDRPMARTIDGPGVAAEAHETLEQLAAHDVDLAAVCDQLEAEGVAAFTKSFDELLTTLEVKASAR